MNEFTLKPMTAADIADVATVEGMRKRLSQYAHYDSLTRHVFDAAHYRGLSGEDTMTWLAYEALLERERFRDAVLQAELCKVSSPIILSPSDAKATKDGTFLQRC